MRSETSRPLALRRSCTSRTTSRDRPRWRRPSSRFRSSATTSPPSRDTAKPCWPRTRSCRSSGDSSTGWPPSTTVIERPASSAAATATLSSAASAGLSSWTRSRRREPRVLKFGTSSNWSTSLSSSAVSISSTLSSSATMSRRISGESAGRKTSARLSGWRTLTEASPRAARPSDVRRRASAICASSSGSDAIPAASAAGQSARCTDSPVARPPSGGATWCRTRTGTAAPAAAPTSSAIVCSVACAARVSPAGASGSVRQKRRRLRRTYQLERSSTRSARAVAAASGS